MKLNYEIWSSSFLPLLLRYADPDFGNFFGKNQFGQKVNKCYIDYA